MNGRHLPISNIKNAFNGRHNYRIGLIFLTGYLLTFFQKMKENNVPKISSFLLLLIVSVFCSLFY